MNVFLAPARQRNARISLEASISRDEVRDALANERRYAALAQEIGTWKDVHCWAARYSKMGTFSQMIKGDLVLFTIAGTGQFNYLGTIAATIESPYFAQRFWRDPKLEDWHLVYFLKPLERIAVDKIVMAQLLGNQPTDRFQTLRKIPQERLNRFPSVPAFVQKLRELTKTTPVAAVSHAGARLNA